MVLRSGAPLRGGAAARRARRGVSTEGLDVPLAKRCLRAADAVCFDFDSTLSTPQFLERFGARAIADKPVLIESMTEDELWANLGGRARVASLRAMLEALASADVELAVLSLGFTAAIRTHLDLAGLTGFFGLGVWGQDTPELQRCDFVKAVLLEEVMRRRG